MSCPFMSGSAVALQPSQHSSDVSKCPMHTHNRALEQPQQEHGTAAAAAAVCPLGFGSSRGPKLGTLHCPICKGLLFDAHMSTGCKHTFCHTCLSRTRDCPVCGMDVAGMEPNTELAGLVDTFLDTHSKSPQLVAAQADLGPLPDNSEASFFMAQGLKSLAGGNTHAALHRLSRCREALLQAAAASTQQGTSPANPAAPAGTADMQQAAAAAEPAAAADADAAAAADGAKLAPTAVAAACQMAAVCGSLGDCYQRLGNQAQAEQLYYDSMAAVDAYADLDAEAAHALSVSLNKLGDMRYSQEQLEEAKQLYRRALQLRQLASGPLTGGRAGPAQQLELASSLIKVADVCRALCEPDEADQLLRTAAGVCFEVERQEADLSPGTARKLGILLDVLHAQGSAAAC
ncbi:hypothetical protein COO60DRAFT_1700345 [Scenedesmus sp. NREL 46B-D3]|nr:hypothetical protein COO60DRAFT_1700345 [Scenedesmus sp. NREL 46B-D3]